MGRLAIAAAFALSLLGPLARRLEGAAGPGPGWLGEDLSLTALALLGWIALAGLPRAGRGPASGPGGLASGPGGLAAGLDGLAAGLDGAGSPGASSGSGPLAVVGLSLPALALAVAADLGAGRTAVELAWTAGPGLLFVALLAAAADLGRGRDPHALAWLVAVPLIAVAPALATWGRGDVDAFVAASPLGWMYLRAVSPLGSLGSEAGLPGGVLDPWLSSLLMSLLLSLTVLAVAGVGARTEPRSAGDPRTGAPEDA